MTIREQIMVAIMAHLETVDRPSSIPAPVRTRLESPGADQLPALTVYQKTEVVDPTHDEKEGRKSRGSLSRRALDVHLEAVVKTVSGTPADSAADPLLAWATAALYSIGRIETVSAPRGLANDPPDEVGTVFQYEQGEFSFCRAILTFRVFYQSARGNAEALH
jgi:hypothetical protein